MFNHVAGSFRRVNLYFKRRALTSDLPGGDGLIKMSLSLGWGRWGFRFDVYLGTRSRRGGGGDKKDCIQLVGQGSAGGGSVADLGNKID